MASTIKILEELVSEAAIRLKGSSKEQEQLRREVQSLRHRLDRASVDDEAQRAWTEQRRRVVTGIREALAELKGPDVSTE